MHCSSCIDVEPLEVSQFARRMKDAFTSAARTPEFHASCVLSCVETCPLVEYVGPRR